MLGKHIQTEKKKIALKKTKRLMYIYIYIYIYIPVYIYTSSDHFKFSYFFKSFLLFPHVRHLQTFLSI